MKRFHSITSFLLLCFLQVNAQTFLDIHQNEKVTHSIATNNIDSILFDCSIPQEKRMNVYYDGKVTNGILLNAIDSITFFNTADEQLTYLGIIGFNQNLYEKPLDVLSSSTSMLFKVFIDTLTSKDGTLLYYAVDYAIDMLAQKTFNTPLNSVYLITFTDGLDQGSLMMNGSYYYDVQYLNAISNKIDKIRIKGLPLTAYSLGLRGSDVTNYDLFRSNLNKLASTSENAFEVNSMNEINNCLSKISEQIIKIANKQTISLKIPGQGNGTLIRFTFDGLPATSSSLYIEGTFNLPERSLVNVNYHGIKTSNDIVVHGSQNGIFVTFSFKDIEREDGNGLIDINNIQEY